MRRIAVTLIGLASIPALTMGCGLDWTLPTNHFDGVEEHGYVSYWETIAKADLGDGLVVPVNINFDSHREASSPYLGKGWLVALLESHVEPLDENNMKVIMPDGWNFYFQRDGNAETWHGNAGWKGETNNTVFTITAPCGWRIKFDGGKVQEIDSNKNRVLSYKYNGPVVGEVDVDGKPFVRIDNDATSGAVQDLVIGDQKIDIALAQRPRVMAKLTQNLITGFDASLSRLRWANAKTESFVFSTADKTLDPTLFITRFGQPQRSFSWDASAGKIKTDGEWTYQSAGQADHPGEIVDQRINRNLQTALWDFDPAHGTETDLSTDGTKTIKSRYASGILAGKIHKIEQVSASGAKTLLYLASYDEKGRLIRSKDNLGNVLEWRDVDGGRELFKNGIPLYAYYLDSQNRITKKVFEQSKTIQTFVYSERDVKAVTQFSDGSAFTKTADQNGMVISQGFNTLVTTESALIGPTGEKQ